MKRTSRARLALWLLLILAAVVGCSLTPQQGWRRSRGPVVPHDTFPADCTLCHLEGSWTAIRADFTYDHAKETGHALAGAHAKAECLRCHNDRGPVQVYAGRGCAGCHEDVHQGHVGRRCQDCHEQNDWVPRAQIAMHNTTRFPLVGAHAATACWRCHEGAQVGNFQRADVRCETCHADDLARALNPDHRQRGWTTGCERCHTPTDWRNARFGHTWWPLTGAHTGLQCSECHANNVYVGTPRDCVACHRDDYDGTTDPNHRTLGFSTRCEECHTTASWEGARFAHTTWPLTGAHLARRCSECHAGGVYTGTPRACAGCHLDEYQRTTNPNHTTAGFPTTCESCHGTTTWLGARFNHRFPIATGKHAGNACTACHTTPGNYAAFSCLGCHEHNQTKMNDTHRGMPGYSWTTAACYQCHPNGRKP